LYDVNTGPQWWIESNVGGLQIWLCSPSAVPNCADNWELPKEKESGGRLFDGSYDPSLDGVVCFKGHVGVWTSRWHSQGLIMGLEDDAGGASTTVTKFEMLTFPKRPKASDCITNLIPDRCCVRSPW
jgi:hypothetical protein